MVLITGATGILGRVLALELLKKGKKVRATKRATSNLDEVRHSLKYYTDDADEWFKKIEWVDVDFSDLDALRKALINVDEIYHCSANVSFHPKDTAEMLKTNVEFTQNLLYIAEEVAVKKFLFVSSIAVLDKKNEQGELDENSDFDTKAEHSGYAKSKYLAEMEVWRANAEGMNTIIINPAVIIGSGNWNSSSGELLPKLTQNSYAPSGGTAYVDVRDVAKIAVMLMEKQRFGERFILVSENKRFKDLADKVRTILGKNETKILPHWVLKLGYGLNILLGWLIPDLRMIGKSNIEAITGFTPISNAKIVQELDYTFIPVEESVKFHLGNYQKER